jgi:phosphate transport system permease protein
VTAPTIPVAIGDNDAGASRRMLVDRLFRAALISAIAIALIVLVVLLVDVISEGWSRLTPDLLTKYPSTRPENAGARSAIMGTIWVIVTAAALTVPIGVGAAVYLEEFAQKSRWYNRLIEVNVQNLAAVPSIVYGILGLAFVSRGFLGFGPTVLTAAITLALLVLPVVIISAREAIRAVPDSFRQGSLALGATPMQTAYRQVLPNAVPGIATGVILALSRAIGEAAPLLLLGALTFVTFDPEGFDSPFTVLPVQIYGWISRPQLEFHKVAAAAILVLMVILFTMNAVAIFVRNRYSKR